MLTSEDRESPDYRLDNPDLLGTLRPNTAAELHAATLAVCAWANDAGDAREILRMLGVVV